MSVAIGSGPEPPEEIIETGQDPTAVNAPPAEAKTTGGGPAPIPYARFKEVNDQLAALKTERAKLDEATKAAELKQLEEAQEFKTLAERHAEALKAAEPKLALLNDYEKSLRTYLDAELQNVPKHMLPLLEKLSVAEQLTYITENREAFAKPAVPNINGAAGGADKRGIISDEAVQRTRKLYGIR